MRILLIRTSALGDIIHCLPVLRALRRNFPDAKIGWVVEKVFAPLVENHPDLDAVFPVRMRGWRRGLHARAVRAEIAAAYRAIRAFRAEVALDLMGNHKGGALARLSGAPRVLGAARKERREPSSAIWIGEQIPVRRVHAVDRAMDLLAPFGLAEEAVDFGPDELLPGNEWTHPRPYLLIQAGAGWVNKTWPPERWGEVARRLREEFDLDVLVPIAPGEEHLAQAVAETSDGAAEAIPSRGFDVLAAQIRGARMLLGGDTGPLHMAHALGVPVLCVMGPTDPLRNGPWNAPDRAVVHRLPCSFCHKRYAQVMACLQGVTPEAVARRAAELLRSESSSP